MRWELLCSPDYAVTWLEIVLGPKNRHRKHLIWLSEIQVYDHLSWIFACMYLLLFIIKNHMLYVKKYFTIFVDVLSINKHLNLSVQKNNSQISTNIRHFQLMGIYHLPFHGRWYRKSPPYPAVYQSGHSYTFPWFLESKQAVLSVLSADNKTLSKNTSIPVVFIFFIIVI